MEIIIAIIISFASGIILSFLCFTIYRCYKIRILKNKLKEYIDKNYKFPDLNNKLYIKYNKNIDELESFRNEYCYYFDDNIIYYHKSIEKLENYIKENNKLPNKLNSNILISHMYCWLEKQKDNHVFFTYFVNKYDYLLDNNINIIVDEQ
jgi:hypothetical protein